MLYGGPAEVVYGFLFCFFFGLFMALSMVSLLASSNWSLPPRRSPPVDADTTHPQAEISSPYVTAGGPYFWSGCVAVLLCACLFAL